MEDRSNDLFVVVRFLGDKAYPVRDKKTHIFNSPFEFDGVEGVFSTMADAAVYVFGMVELVSNTLKYDGSFLESNEQKYPYSVLFKKNFKDGTEAEWTIAWEIYEVQNYVQ